MGPGFRRDDNRGGWRCDLLGLQFAPESSRDGAMGIDIEPYDIVGFAGAAVFVAAYFANQQSWLRSEDWRYPFANLVGAVLILVSLVFEWNFPSVVIEVFWAIISVYGMAKSLRERASP